MVIAIHDKYLRGFCSGDGMEVASKCGDELAFGAIAVKADIEGLRELEMPLREGTRMYGVKVVV